MAHVVSSNQNLDKLVLLNMKDCSNLQSLPQLVDLESLEVLDLSGCSELKSIQGFPRNLKRLYLVGTAVKELPPLPWSIELLVVCLLYQFLLDLRNFLGITHSVTALLFLHTSGQRICS